MMMTIDMYAILYAEVKVAGEALNAFPKLENGLTTDAAKSSPEWRAARKRYHVAFSNLRLYNSKRRK
jgi:hypothetical protein